MNTFFVYLRQPGGLHDRRDDPFWEFGSFGSTGCHSTNLMHLTGCPIKRGDRLAFLQGGAGEIRVVGLTPPVIDVRTCGEKRREVIWPDTYRPMRFGEAPALVTNSGETAFPAVLDILKGVRKNSFCGKASSKLRSCKQPIPDRLANEMAAWFASKQSIENTVRTYTEAITRPECVWYRHASLQPWPLLEQRQYHYHMLTGVPTLPLPATTLMAPEPNFPEASRKRRRC